MEHFQTTLWTMVLNAGGNDPAQASSALAELCQAYWYPLYAFVRRQGYQAHDAQDLTQAFFTRLLEKQALGQVNRDKGRFRSFLLAALRNFLANEWDKGQAQKRGRQSIISLDHGSAESRYGLEPSHEL
jgi:RNA polymerase sigma-70 factor (ECF subfamily)